MGETKDFHEVNQKTPNGGSIKAIFFAEFKGRSLRLLHF